MLALAACGGGKTFSAEEFVDEVNAQGVHLELGEKLLTDEEDKTLYAVELAQVADLPGEAGGHEHSGGSISVYDDTGGADGEMEDCRTAADLLCYQAANVVVILQGGGIEAQQLGVAIKRLSEEE
jgi:hypothetical protein